MLLPFDGLSIAKEGGFVKPNGSWVGIHHLSTLRPTLRPEIPRPKCQEGRNFPVKLCVHECLPIPFNELRAIPKERLRDRSRHTGWIMQFHIRVCHQIAILLEVMSNADLFIMSSCRSMTSR